MCQLRFARCAWQCHDWQDVLEAPRGLELAEARDKTRQGEARCLLRLLKLSLKYHDWQDVLEAPRDLEHDHHQADLPSEPRLGYSCISRLPGLHRTYLL